MYLKRFHISISLLFIMLLVEGCKIADPPQLMGTINNPDTFQGKTDSTSIGDSRWTNFFNDKHLVKLINIALEQNLDLLTTLERIERARADFDISRGALLPSVDLRFRGRTGNLNEPLLENNINGVNIDNQVQDYFLGFHSHWEADIWGKLKSRRKADYYRFLASEEGLHLTTTYLVAEVARQYYELLGLDNELVTIEKNVALQETALELIKIQKIGGRATELAVQQFHAQLLRTQSLGIEKKQRIIEVENQINVLLGRYPQSITRDISILDQHLPEVVKVGVPSNMLFRRPDIRQAEMVLFASKFDVEAARAEFYPSFTITPYAGVHSHNITTILNAPQSLIFGFITGATAPIFEKRRIRANYNRSIAFNKEAFYNYQNAILTGYEEVTSSLNRVENFREIYYLREQETAVLLDAVSTANALYSAGYASYLEVITAQRSVLDAELSMTNTRKDAFIAIIDLYRALGGGWY